MRLRSFFWMAMAAALMTVAFSSCSNKFKPLANDMVQVDPSPLQLIGGEIPAQVTLKFPPKWMNKKAIITVTPVLKFAGETVKGPAFQYQGEKVRNNYRVISYKYGSTEKINFAFDYLPIMDECKLYIDVTAQVGKRNIGGTQIEVAQGLITTAGLADLSGSTPAIAPDGFSRIIKEAYTADIHFLIQRAEVRAQELRKGEVSDWKDVVENADQVPNQNVSVEVQAYASPDGGLDLNERLSQQREKNTSRALTKELKGYNIPIDAHYTAEDWEGFKELLEQSNIQDKELVLRVLSMYDDPVEREEQIKNISMVFKQLADEILPQLRRSRLIANVEIIGKSDDEIKELVANRPSMLRIDELLYAATLTNIMPEQERIYKECIKVYPKDFRAYNNLAAIYMTNGQVDQAKALLDQAEQLQANPQTTLNRALIALSQGQAKEAGNLIGQATGIDEVNDALGMLYLAQGKFAQAEQMMKGSASNNAAIAQLMTKRYADAMNTLNQVAQPNAQTHYLKAVICARTNNLSGLTEHLGQAIRMNPSMASKAAKDLEFASFRMNPTFSSLLK